MIKSVEHLVEVSAVLSGASPKTQVLATKSAAKAAIWQPTTTPTRSDPREIIIPNEVIEAFIQATNSDVPPWIKAVLSDSEIEFVREAVRAGLGELAKESLSAILIEQEIARRIPSPAAKSAFLKKLEDWRVSRKAADPDFYNNKAMPVPEPQREVLEPILKYALSNFTLDDAQPVQDGSQVEELVPIWERVRIGIWERQAAALEEDTARRQSGPETRSPGTFPALRPTPTEELTT